MKTQLLSLVLLLASGGAQAIEKFNCLGTEPFWALELTDEGAFYSSMEGENVTYNVKYGAPEGTTMEYVMTVGGIAEAKVDQEHPSILIAFVSNLSGFIVGSQSVRPHCSDGMSDRDYPYSINMMIEGRFQTGCCYSTSKPFIGE